MITKSNPIYRILPHLSAAFCCGGTALMMKSSWPLQDDVWWAGFWVLVAGVVLAAWCSHILDYCLNRLDEDPPIEEQYGD